MQMQPALDALLCQRYSALYAARQGDAQLDAMGWGFQVGDGWFDIIDALSEVLTARAKADGVPCPVAQEVKEKFGGLRFRVDRPDPYRPALGLAAEMSLRTCEVSGRPGRLHCVDKRQMMTLAPGLELSRHGVPRLIVPALEDDNTTDPTGISAMGFSLEDVVARRKSVLAGAVDVPAALYDLTDAALREVQTGIGWFKGPMVQRIWFSRRCLRFEWSEEDARTRALSAMAAALSMRIADGHGTALR